MMFRLDQLKTEQGKPRTKSLFYELCQGDETHVIFTTKEIDHEVRGKTYLSLRKLFLALVPQDPTEYEFSQAVFGSWSVWEAMCRSPLLKSHIAEWRKEAEVKIRSEAIQSIAEEMRSNGRSSFGAAKLLLERGWLDKEAASKAKQKLQEVEEEKMNNAALKLLEDDAERLGLIKGPLN